MSAAPAESRKTALLAAAAVFAVIFVLRFWFVPPAGSPVLFSGDEAEMHEASLGVVLGAPPQRLIWPGGLMRHAVLVHLGASWLADASLAKSPDGFARHIGQVLLSPGESWRWMRLCGGFIAAAGFASLVWLAVRTGVPVLWAAGLCVAAAAFPLHWMSGCMATPDALAWGLVLISLVVTHRGAVFAGAVIAGLAIGTKLTVLPLLPFLALLAVSRGHAVSRSRIAGAWCCGLLLGLLVANPYFLADPVRMIKTMVGVLKFKSGDFIGLAGALGYLVRGIPLWLVVLGFAALLAAWRWQQRAMVAGAIISMLWMIQASAASKQVMERYFIPLGMLLLFLVLIVLLPVLATVKGRMRAAFSILVVALAAGTCVDGWLTMQRTLRGMNDHYQPETELGSFLSSMKTRRIAVESSLFAPHVIRHASADALNSMAEALESGQVAHRSVSPTLSGFGFSDVTIRVLGGLFNETEVNMAARLRAMAGVTTGQHEMDWFSRDRTSADSRIWRRDAGAVADQMQKGELDAAVFDNEAPVQLAGYPRHVFEKAHRKLYLIIAPGRPPGL